jgi:transketolase
MEGISGEAASLAGHLGLDNIVFFYDDNHITIDGKTDLAFSEDVGKRYEAYGWFVQRIDGHDHAAIRAALDQAVAEPARPSLIVARTHIAYGSPNKHDSSKAHGEPLGAVEVKATKENTAARATSSFQTCAPFSRPAPRTARKSAPRGRSSPTRSNRTAANGPPSIASS